MTLISCPDCDHQCSITAFSCPNCGHRFTPKVKLPEAFSGLGAVGRKLKEKLKNNTEEYTFPLIVGDKNFILRNFILNKESITYKNKDYNLQNDINKVKIKNSKFTVNGIPSVSTKLSIEMVDRTHMDIAIKSTFKNRKNREKLEVAGEYIRKVTFNNRLTNYLSQLTEKKEITAGEYKIYSAGYISKGKNKINYIESYEKGLLHKGTQISGYSYSEYNPNELIIASGNGFFANKIIVNFEYDSDVLNHIIFTIANIRSTHNRMVKKSP